MNETDMAEMMEWQARCRDLETSKEQIREERDVARLQWQNEHEKSELYWGRIVELESALSKATMQIERLRLHLQQGIEL